MIEAEQAGLEKGTIQPSPFTLLDCTLRDGGYYTDWHFDLEMVTLYVHLCAGVGIDVIELGYLRAKETQWGIFGNLPHQFPSALSETLCAHPQIRIALMLELKEWSLLPAEGMIQTLKAKLVNLAFPVSILRIAVHFSQLTTLDAYLPRLLELGYDICINLMQIDLASERELQDCFTALQPWSNLAALYLADSLGSLNPQRVEHLFTQFGQRLPYALGFHAHDNMGLALHNSLIASQAGATWIDSTLYGMGRGAGNAKTEQLLPLLRPDLPVSHCSQLDSFSANYLHQLHHQYQWGANPLYGLSGKMRIHPSYVQVLERDRSLCMEEKLDILFSLGQKHASTYSPKQLESMMEAYV